MKKWIYAAIMAATTATTACSTEDPWSDLTQYDNSLQPSAGPGTNGGGTSASGTALASILGTFDVTLNDAALAETETLPGTDDAYYEDYVETYSPTATIRIHYDGAQATVDGAADGVTVTAEGAHVTVHSESKGLTYELSGTTADGSLKVYSEKKFALVLNGVSISNPSGAAINNQGKRMYVVLADGTTNTLSDGTTYTMTENEDQKGTLFSEGKLAFSGSGSLVVTAQGKNGIVSDDYVLIRPNTNISVKATASNGIKTNDGIVIRGGVVNIETTAAASKGLKTDGCVLVEGGRTTIITKGGTEYDTDDREYKGCACVKADSTITIRGGELYVKSTGGGGKGVSGDQQLCIEGGTVRAIASGANSNDVSAKAIKVDGDLTVAGGDVMARASSHEAIETKGRLTMTAGSVAACSSDDAVNSAKDMTIDGGYLFAYSTGNDGIDANGNLTVNGGLVIGCGATSPEEGIDAAEGKTLAFNGGTVIGLGGGAEATSGTQQKATVSGVSVGSGQYLVVSDGSGKVLFAFQSPRTYSGATLQVSSPELKSGVSYTLSTATTATGNDDFYGFMTSATTGELTTMTTFTTSTTTNGGMGGAGGGFPGGAGGGGGRPGGW